MSPNPAARRSCLGLLVLVLSLPSLGLAKKDMKKGGDFDLSGMIRPELLNSPNDPTLRFPVMPSEGSIFGLTYGWLDISNSAIRYTAVEPEGKSSRSFEASRLGVTEIRLEKGWLSFKTEKKRPELTYLPQDLWGTVHAGPGMSSVANRQSLGTQSIYKTLLNFDRVVALLSAAASPSSTTKPGAPGQAAKATAPPAIVLSSPPGSDESQSIEWHDATLVIRGVAMDSTGIPVVRINGMAANMRAQTAQAAEFWSDPLTLQMGNNTIQIVAANSSQLESTRVLYVNYKPGKAPLNTKGLDKQNILALLQGGVPAARIVDLVSERGIKFSPSASDLKEIRSAGGTDALIQAIQQANH